MARYLMSWFGYPYSYGYRRYPYPWAIPDLPLVPYAYGYGAPIAPTREEERGILENDSKLPEQQLAGLRKRMAELK